ncbi:MAG TPA: hypothetical protein VFQ45_14960 [Longimicrobium sp.]|nr:hypothetical protein [Longimicrobium sp.]
MPHRHHDTLDLRTPRHARHAGEAPPLGPYEMRYDVCRGYDDPVAAAPRRAHAEPVYGARRAPDR